MFPAYELHVYSVVNPCICKCRKSTLLDVLAGRKTVGQLEGKVLFAGVAPTHPFLRRYTGKGR
jgi:hypothetical protein